MIDPAASSFAEALLKEWIELQGRVSALKRVMRAYADDDQTVIRPDLRRIIIDVVLAPAAKPQVEATRAPVEAPAASPVPRARGRWTDERVAIVNRDWPTMRAAKLIRKDLNDLPGPFVTPNDLSNYTSRKGINRPAEMREIMAKRFKGRGPSWGNAGREEAPEPKPVAVKAPAPNKKPESPRTNERLALLDELYPACTPTDEIVRQLNELPGIPVSSRDVLAWVVARGLRKVA